MPARSMSVSEGVPAAIVARSAAAICSGVRTASTGLILVPGGPGPARARLLPAVLGWLGALRVLRRAVEEPPGGDLGRRVAAGARPQRRRGVELVGHGVDDR